METNLNLQVGTVLRNSNQIIIDIHREASITLEVNSNFKIWKTKKILKNYTRSWTPIMWHLWWGGGHAAAVGHPLGAFQMTSFASIEISRIVSPIWPWTASRIHRNVPTSPLILLRRYFTHLQSHEWRNYVKNIIKGYRNARCKSRNGGRRYAERIVRTNVVCRCVVYTTYLRYITSYFIVL